jgi:hypothetical protein
MLHRERRLKGTLVRGTDGDLGVVEGFHFDERRWTITHILVSRDESLNGGTILISPASIQPNWSIAMLVANLSQRDVRGIPATDADASLPVADAEQGHVRSTDQLIGFHLQASDGEIGHVDDLLIDEANWRICSIVVDTSNWIGGKWVAIVPSVLRSVDWSGGTIAVAITREEVKNSPAMDSMPVPSAETMPPFVLM